MAQYIDKAAVAAELKRRINNLYPKRGQGIVVTKILKDHYEGLLSFLDTLETKDIDLEEEIDKELDENWYGEYINHEKFRKSAEHFFELGLNARK